MDATQTHLSAEESLDESQYALVAEVLPGMNDAIEFLAGHPGYQEQKRELERIRRDVYQVIEGLGLIRRAADAEEVPSCS